jgi:hypothetical protein
LLGAINGLKCAMKTFLGAFIAVLGTFIAVFATFITVLGVFIAVFATFITVLGTFIAVFATFITVLRTFISVIGTFISVYIYIYLSACAALQTLPFFYTKTQSFSYLCGTQVLLFGKIQVSKPLFTADCALPTAN